MEQEKIFECSCGCTIIRVYKYEDSETMKTFTYGISAYESSFGARQSKLLQYLSRLWSAVRGKDYHLYEVLLTEEKFKELAEIAK